MRRRRRKDPLPPTKIDVGNEASPALTAFERNAAWEATTPTNTGDAGADRLLLERLYLPNTLAAASATSPDICSSSRKMSRHSASGGVEEGGGNGTVGCEVSTCVSLATDASASALPGDFFFASCSANMERTESANRCRNNSKVSIDPAARVDACMILQLGQSRKQVFEQKFF
jgi:hypothetical protein